MEFKIDRLGINGEGIAQFGNDRQVCFFDGALPQETIEGEIVERKKNFCIGKVNKILKESSDRVSPRCQYYDICGGCNLQHMSRDLQVKAKTDAIRYSLRRLAHIDNVDIEELVRVNDFGYRNKMVFPYVYDGERSILGMFERGSHKVVDIDRCILASSTLNDFLSISKEYLNQSGFSGYDYSKESGDMRYLVVRASDRNVLVTIVATHMLENLNEYYETLKRTFLKVGLSIVIGDGKDEIMSGEYIHLFGETALEFDEMGVKYSVDNRGFLQVNNDLKEKLYDFVLSNIEDGADVVDAYSGAGLMTAIIAKKCHKVFGIEINKSASDSARKLARYNGLDNVECICGDVKDNIAGCLKRVKKCTVVLDPARAGCSKSIIDILNAFSEINMRKSAKYSQESDICRVSKIIYVSCNTSTLCRDLASLNKCYKITSITPMDMFPQTSHCEVVVVLESR